MDYIFVLVTGAFGGILRTETLGIGVLGTIAVNLLGSFILGVLLGTRVSLKSGSPLLRLGLITGFLGSFTSFSSFIWDALQIGDTHVILALGYMLLTIVGGLLSYWLGEQCAVFTAEWLREREPSGDS